MLVWLDLETGGLDPKEHRILEIGMIVTRDDLSEIGRFHSLVRFLEEPEHMDEPARIMHEKSGLLQAARAFDVPVTGVEDRAIDFLEECGIPPGEIPLAGSNVGFDRAFLREWMHRLVRCFHYRNVDVSTITELVRRWHPEVYERRPGAGVAKEDMPHRAIPDLEMSIALLRFYRAEVFRPSTGWGF